MTTPFENEVHRIALTEGLESPQVTFRKHVPGTAATAPSGRRIVVDSRVLTWTEPAQRWLAAHEMWHAIAHRWRAPARWVPLFFSVLSAAVLVAVGWLFRGSTAIAIVPGIVLLVWLAAISWWSRRLEADADRYAAAGGYRDDLDGADLLEFLTNDANVPRWRSSHGRWAERLHVRSDALPEPLMHLSSQIKEIGTELADVAGHGWERPYRLLVVQHLPKGQLALGRWPGVIVATRDGLATPAHLRRFHLWSAVIASRRLPQLRACFAAFLGSVGLAATMAFAAGLNTHLTGSVMAGSAIALLAAAAYEGWRRINDHNLLHHVQLAGPSVVDDQPTGTTPQDPGF